MSQQPFLVFSIAGARLALPLLQVKEVVALPHLTPVPTMPPTFRGVMNLRGAVHPVIDLRARLGKPTTTDEETAVIVLAGKNPAGAVVDSVDRVVSVSADEIIDGNFVWEHESVAIFDMGNLLEEVA